MAKRIQMRKQRFMAIQKIAEQKKLQAEGGGPGGPGDHSHAPKQTVSNRQAGKPILFNYFSKYITKFYI